MADNRGTLTPLEHSVLEFLEGGPADLGERTEQTTVRAVPRLWDAANNIVAGARLADYAKSTARQERLVRTVEAKTARRLAKAGLVTIDNGRATLVPAVEDVAE